MTPFEITTHLGQAALALFGVSVVLFIINPSAPPRSAAGRLFGMCAFGTLVSGVGYVLGLLYLIYLRG